jgi:hypothetical protein
MLQGNSKTSDELLQAIFEMHWVNAEHLWGTAKNNAHRHTRRRETV